MRFVDISVDQFGVLDNARLPDLSPGMTVVFGGNGSGKTTAVSFLRGLLFGFTTDHEAFQSDDGRFGGSVSMKSHGRSFRLTRERSRGISSDLSVMDLGTGVSAPAASAQLPTWINETVYQEIFSVGDQEAARFDLLTRLCLDDNGRGGAEDEIHRTERAIAESVREREGSKTEPGLRQNISGLQRRKEELNADLARLRQTSPEVPARIAEVEAELLRLKDHLVAIDREIAEVQARIREIEERLEILRRRNVVELNRHEIEQEISRLSDRQRRWTDIRQSIQAELSGLQSTASKKLQGTDALKSIRALVTRLEQRMDKIDGRAADYSGSFSSSDRELFGEHMRGEVFSLCDYVQKHEASLAAHESSLESMLGERTLQDVDNVDAVLQGQIDGLREELSRSENVLKISQHHSLCSSNSHAAWQQSHRADEAVQGSMEQFEAELARLRRRLEELTLERHSVTDRIHQLENELVDLRGRLQAVPALSDVDRLKTSIADLDAQLELLQNRWNVLEHTEANLRTVIERLRGYRSPGILETASEYIERLTEGDCYQLSGNEVHNQILATTRQSTKPQTVSQLSRGTRDQVALALRLALIQHRAESADRCPLVLDDVFITSDDDRAAAVADLLMEVASDGQQIIFFTCQNDVLELFERRNASIRHLEQEEIEPQPVPVAAAMPLVSVPVQAPEPVAPKVSENTNWLFYLEVDNTVEDLSGLTVAEIEAFRVSEIKTIDELLTLSVDDLESRFRKHGYSISRDRIRAWRGQAELASQVPMLRRSDAELLYAAGIQSTVELSRMRPETVYDKVVAFQDSTVGNRYRRSGRSIDRQQAINWSRWSQHSRRLSDARSSRSRYFVRSTDAYNSPADAARLSRSGAAPSGVNYRRARISQTGTTRRRQPRPRMSSEARRDRERRQSRRKSRLSRHSASYRTTSQTADESQNDDRDLRFYLNRSDDVEAAPSIGPRTAQRLGTVGIYTVDDLLNADAFQVAERLNNRRINADTIQQWQFQARLVCQVPELRGHDSQILVACGVTDPEQLAGKRPVDLMAVVGPFADTSEGERIVRGGRKPDLEEVTDWIRWAQSSRSLSSAA